VADDRLIDVSEVELEKAMLRACIEEETPSDVRRRALASLGLLAVAVPTATATTVGTTSGAVASTVGEAAWWQTGLAKAALFLGLGGGFVGATVAYVGWDDAPGEPAPSVVQEPGRAGVGKRADDASPSVPAVEEAFDLSPTDRPLPTPAIDQVVRRDGSGPRAARTTGSVATPARSALPAGSVVMEPKGANSIREEIELLDRARAELRRGSPASARRLIDEYLARYPSGELRTEAEIIKRELGR